MNKAAGVVLNLNTPNHYFPHSSKSCFIQPHWLSVQSKIIFNIGLLTFKSLSTSTLAFLGNFIQQKPNTKILRSSTVPLLKQQSTTNKQTSKSKLAFSYVSFTFWNFLPLTRRKSILISSFKSKLKTYLFKLAYNLLLPNLS